MKIAFIVDEFPSLTQTFVLNQITGLVERGHDVDIFAEKARSGLESHEEIKRYDLLKRTSYHGVPKNKFLRIFNCLYYVVKFIPKNPLAVFRSLNIFQYGIRAANLNLFYQVIPYLEKGPHDIVHCQFGLLAPKALLLKKIGAISGKFVTSFRGYDIFKNLDSMTRVYDELFREGDLFMSVSQSIKQRLIEEGCDKKKIVVHHSGIDCEKFEYSKLRRSNGERTKLLTIERLVEKKGVAYAIEAVNRLIASGKCITYDVIGDGMLRGDLERLIEDLGVGSDVRLLGWRNHEEVIRLLQNAHILVAPSVNATDGDKEGIPNVVKEAMALGLPVISTLHSGIPELVQDGISGFLVPERDVGALAEKLSYLIDHPEIWSGMGRAGRDCVEKHYDINKLNDKLVGNYQRLLN